MRTRIALTLLLASSCSCEDDPIPGALDATAGPGADAAVSSGGDAGGGSTMHRGLRVDPDRARLTTDGVVPARQTFRAIATKSDGTPEDVTAQSTFVLQNPGLGTLTGPSFSGLVGGTSGLVATFGTLTGTASIEVVAERVLVDPGVPPGTPMVFENAPADPSRAPKLVYPNDGVLLPPNLGGIEIHWEKADRGDELFEVRFESALGTVLAYVPCAPLGRGCLYTPDASAWRLLADSHRGRDALRITVRETDARGSGVGQSATISVRFAAQPVLGGLYYWTTSNGTAIMRVDFGAQTAPERFFPFNGGGCFGCHALSRDGRKMTLSRDGQNQGQIRGIDVAARAIIFGADDQEREQFQSWNPTSDRFAAIYGDRAQGREDIRIRDGNDGHVIETIALGVEPTHPDWSPSGDRIAFTHVTVHGTSQRPGRGAIAYVKKIANMWGAMQTLVPAEDTYNRYYPAYSPDGTFLVFDESRCNGTSTYGGECDGDADDNARLWTIDVDGANKVELTRANTPGVGDGTTTTLANTFPKWAPFVDPLRADGTGRVMWMTFSSRRNYGLREPSGSNQQLWMVAVDPDLATRGMDGSYAAFALPFQDLSTSNHVAQWATQIVPPTNADGGVGPGADGGGAGMCIDIGGPCTPGVSMCCSGFVCLPQGGEVFVCRPSI